MSTQKTTLHNHLFIFGNGYVAGHLAKAAQAEGFQVTLSSRTPTTGMHHFGKPLPEGVTHVVSTVPPHKDPHGGRDPVISTYPHLASATPQNNLKFIGYLSSTGVYGDYQGAEVTEQSPLLAAAERSVARMQAEQQWLELPHVVHVFRLSGIYGPGRNIVERLKAGNISGLEQSDRPVNRIHVADICRAVLAAIAAPANETVIYNLADDNPAPTRDVILYAAEKLGLPTPQSNTAASHLVDGSRIVNCNKIKKALNLQWLYPSYKEGLSSFL